MTNSESSTVESTAGESPSAIEALPFKAGLGIPVLAGLGVSLAMGVYARLHEPGAAAFTVPGFSSPLTMKVWLTTIALGLALVQMVSAAGIFGRLGQAHWAPVLHRWSGRLAVLVTLPLVAHCLYVFGFGFDSPRVVVHSVAGCLFFGAFTAKMLTLPRRQAPAWAIPLLGAILSAALVAVWMTSALWFLTSTGFRF